MYKTQQTIIVTNELFSGIFTILSLKYNNNSAKEKESYKRKIEIIAREQQHYNIQCN